MEITVQRYRPQLAGAWKDVLHDARNGIFQFDRDFVEYHGDRFEDMSAVAWVDGRPCAVMPAAFDPVLHKVTSHPGLTFGGPVLVRDLRGDTALAVIDALLDGFRDWGATSCLVKLLPQALANYPSAEGDYGLWRRGFSLVRRDLSSLLPLTGAIPFNTSKSQSVRRAGKQGVRVVDAPVASFHGLLYDVLMAQHGVKPVHSLGELEQLHSKFPQGVLVRIAVLDQRVLAGTLVFNYGHVWHTQYLASSDEGRRVGALDLVIAELIEEAAAAGASHISFGASTVNQGLEVNHGLLWQKESYGARTMVHDFMEGAL